MSVFSRKLGSVGERDARCFLTREISEGIVCGRSRSPREDCGFGESGSSGLCRKVRFLGFLGVGEAELEAGGAESGLIESSSAGGPGGAGRGVQACCGSV